MNRTARIAAGRILRAAGLCFMIAAAFGGLLFRASAAPGVTWPALHVGFDLGVIATPSPLPSAGPVVTPPPIPTRHGGPLTVRLTGNLSLGERYSQSSQTETPGNQSTGNVGVLAELARRTGSTTLRVSVPAGLSGRLANFGELQAEYSTPRYALLYGSQGISALGGLPLGGTLRGLTLTTPLPAGEISFYSGPAFGINGQMLRVSGVRARALVRGQLVELGYSNAASADQSAVIRSLIFGVAATSQRLNVLFEGALQKATIDGFARPVRASYSLRGDYGGGDSYASLTLRHIGDSFVTVGSGVVQSEDYASFGWRRQSEKNQVSIDESLGRTGSGLYGQAQRRGSFSFGHILRDGSEVQLSLIDQRIAGQYGTTWNGGIGLNAAFTARRVTGLALLQFQRTTSSFSDAVSTQQYGLQLQRPFGDYLLQTGYHFARQTTTGLATSTSTITAALARVFGRTALSLGGTYTRAQLPFSDVSTFTPLVQVSRRISSNVTLGMYAGEQFTRDRLNPSFNSHSRVFSMTLSSPFTFGSGHVRGGNNPLLPASISGSVLKDSNGFNTTSAAITDGVPNVVVVLDNNESQRTDLSGSFQFQFIKPGRHELRLETSSLPRGVTADQPFAALDLQGGQDGNVYFRVGAYGSVQGHVMGRDASGALMPLESVSLKMDDAQDTTTTPYGAYGFGRLTPGKHKVKVIVESLPASVTFGADPTQTIEVRTGEISTLDFIADPLGSIEGHVTYDESLGNGFSGGVVNAYVVANPGDHAAITNEDGSFILDNLPAGSYTLDVDPETVPPDTGNISGALTVDLGASQHHEGADFKIGHKLKAVVFSLHQDEAPATLTLLQPALPPFATTEVQVATPFDATAVTVSAFGKNIPLTAAGSKRLWKGRLQVPGNAPAGAVDINATVTGSKHTEAAAPLKVDPSIPVVRVALEPSRPSIGQYVRVRARFLADVKPGDIITWQDGTKTRLGQPLSGRVYEFSVKITLYPMRGFMLIGPSKLPIILR